MYQPGELATNLPKTEWTDEKIVKEFKNEIITNDYHLCLQGWRYRGEYHERKPELSPVFRKVKERNREDFDNVKIVYKNITMQMVRAIRSLNKMPDSILLKAFKHIDIFSELEPHHSTGAMNTLIYDYGFNKENAQTHGYPSIYLFDIENWIYKSGECDCFDLPEFEEEISEDELWGIINNKVKVIDGMQVDF